MFIQLKPTPRQRITTGKPITLTKRENGCLSLDDAEHRIELDARKANAFFTICREGRGRGSWIIDGIKVIAMWAPVNPLDDDFMCIVMRPDTNDPDPDVKSWFGRSEVSKILRLQTDVADVSKEEEPHPSYALKQIPGAPPGAPNLPFPRK
jgi:hypothetical protein